MALISCKGSSESSLTDQEKMEQSVQTYLFLGDTIDVAVEVVDTILVEELDQMLTTIDENLFLVQEDIDTLEGMIDTLAYEKMEYEKSVMMRAIGLDRYTREVNEIQVPLLQHQLKMAELRATKLSFKQSERIMLALRRTQLNSVAGYKVVSTYTIRGEQVELGFLMDSDFRIID